LGCKEKLSWHYPASEILTGVVFAIAGYFSKFYLNIAAFNVVYFLFLLTIFSSYLVIFFTDIKFNLIPDKVVFPTIYFVIVGTIGFKVYQLFDYYNFLKNDNFGKFMLEAGYFNDVVLSNAKTIGFGFLAAFIIAAFFVLLILITKGRGMGLGDVKLGFLIGLFNGFPNAFLAIFLGFLFGAVFSIVLVALRLKKIKDTIAFGPFLIMGSFVAYFWGQVILDWYVKMFS
jgi:prepilin signal peptidase PulO-like enzyme (type II secretory pathway)